MSDPFDPTVARSARVYDVLLGGKTNFAADRAAAAHLTAQFPSAPLVARENRRFMQRVVHWMALHGVTQFLDLGTGIPTSPNVHEIAQQVTPRARVVYVDHDPLVLAHARALLISHPAGAVAYIHADIRDPVAILGAARLHDVIDLAQPVGLLAIAALHFVPDPYAQQTMRELLSVLTPGSFVAVTHFTTDLRAPADAARARDVAARMGTGVVPRTRDELARLFDGRELVEPGIVALPRWQPDGGQAEPGGLSDADVSMFAAVASCS
ncbi:SAM-dependent methyltransferase [Catenuloplanes japonicus]|uniref:SAM-dependent methyltransferase n=1 Tax=Catenuloplanes japonicus TaxID=33876 RepID=UPI00052576B0